MPDDDLRLFSEASYFRAKALTDLGLRYDTYQELKDKLCDALDEGEYPTERGTVVVRLRAVFETTEDGKKQIGLRKDIFLRRT